MKALALIVVVTHWLLGVAVFVNLLINIVGPLLFVLSISAVFTVMRFEYRATRRAAWRAAGVVVALVISIALNFLLVILLRFPVNLAVILYGNPSYPYLGPHASTHSEAVNGAFHALFYLLQVSSASCSTLRSADSVATSLSFYLSLV